VSTLGGPFTYEVLSGPPQLLPSPRPTHVFQAWPTRPLSLPDGAHLTGPPPLFRSSVRRRALDRCSPPSRSRLCRAGALLVSVPHRPNRPPLIAAAQAPTPLLASPVLLPRTEASHRLSSRPPCSLVSTSRRQSIALTGIRIEAPPPLVFPHSTVSYRYRDLRIKLAASLTPTVPPELWEHSASPLATSPPPKLLGELPPPRRCHASCTVTTAWSCCAVPRERAGSTDFSSWVVQPLGLQPATCRQT
jgi:hypothetical protein